MTVRYDYAYRCTGGPTPGAIAVRDHWRKVTGLGDLGIYNCRSSTGGGGYSIHSEGRAVDLAANAYNTSQRAKAENYIRFLIANSERIQCQMLIWNRRDWRSGVGWTSYGGESPHTDHIHVELNRTGAQSVTMSLLDSLWAQWQGQNPTSQEFHLSVEQYNAIMKKLGELDSEATIRHSTEVGYLSRIEGHVNGLVSTIRSSGKNVANAFRRIMGVPISTNTTTQANNDTATGTKVQRHLNS
jgi:hypothetical protein